jgi:hypothetical protein
MRCHSDDMLSHAAIPGQALSGECANIHGNAAQSGLCACPEDDPPQVDACSKLVVGTAGDANPNRIGGTSGKSRL